MIARWVFVWCFWLIGCAVYASDQQRELEYAASIENSSPVGRVVWLEAKQQKFLALFTESEKTRNQQAAIILHDLGEHPDNQVVVHGLRTEMPRHNWASLSIQLPLREVGALANDYYGLFDEAHGRILAAVKYLQDQGAQQIALVGYGTGAAMAAYSLSLKPEGLLGLAAISLPMTDSPIPQAQTGEFIRKIALPMLDIYAEFDLPDVADTARQRRMLAKDNPGYRQAKLNGEDHHFQQDPALLVKQVYSWLTYILTH